jgi:hypothetical protein
MVQALSDCEGHPKPPWAERKRSYLTRLIDEPAEVKLIAAADKLHNARSLCRDLRSEGASVWGRFKASPDDTMWYFRSVLQALAHGWSHPVLGELEQAVGDLSEVARELTSPDAETA